MTTPNKLQQEIKKKTLARLGPLFERYRLDHDDLESVMKWKSIVLILGNFSSGKSTLINELFESNIQRTGQSPTDDSFTVLTAPAKGEPAREIPGSSLVNDERLPFTAFKEYGDQFTSHFLMKEVESDLLENLAIIDSPGMLDAITEKDRGYDYARVVGDLAHLADLVVLMFDPHKAGTIREAYETIRNTLPESLGEDRILFVMSRLDECDNPADLVRSYGTLCWNLSQMTGRKDIPRIFLTYSPNVSQVPENMSIWNNERNELKERILSAQKMRVSHILQHVDRQARELRMIAEAMTSIGVHGRTLLGKTLRGASALALFLFLFLDIISRKFLSIPDTTLLTSLANGSAGLPNLLVPLAGAGAAYVLAFLLYSRYLLPRLIRKSAASPDDLVDLGTRHRLQLWKKIRTHTQTLVADAGLGDVIFSHRKHIMRIERFLDRDLQEYYSRNQ
ncbi:MAG: dynamin family protein [Proteobacteria bacterium]|nr:dynamin family protein [Pseudomonadota bacterium]MBU1736987.1 dynamin family protein [Pseudomonadota bacterium]